MADHDGGYKLLFAHPRLVEELLRDFVPEPWVERLDFSTLERCEGSYISRRFSRLEQDMVWRVRWKGKSEGEREGDATWLYVYLLLELQSRVDRFMAVRMLAYVGLFYLNLVRVGERTPSGKLPAVLPLVLYNGDRRWWAPRQVGGLIERVPGGLETYRPSLEYLLIDEGEHSEEALAALHTLVALLFRLERSRTPHEIRDKVEALAQKLQGADDDSLRRAFGQWLNEVLLPSRFPEAEIPEAGSLEETQTMLRERVIEWTREWKQEGLQQGLEQGLQRGRQEGERRILLRLLERKFGSVDPATQHRIEEADDRQLLAWGERVLTSERLEDVFGS